MFGFPKRRANTCKGGVAKRLVWISHAETSITHREAPWWEEFTCKMVQCQLWKKNGCWCKDGWVTVVYQADSRDSSGEKDLTCHVQQNQYWFSWSQVIPVVTVMDSFITLKQKLEKGYKLLYSSLRLLLKGQVYIAHFVIRKMASILSSTCLHSLYIKCT